MLRMLALRTVLAFGAIVLGVFSLVPADPFLARAEAGKKARAYERKVLRHKEHELKREERHHLREAAREKRQAAYLKRVLAHHKKR